jgi:hypothetical protein
VGVAAVGAGSAVGVVVVVGAVVVLVAAAGAGAVVVVVAGGTVVVGCAGWDAFVELVRRVLSVTLAASGREDPQAAKVISGRVTAAMARARPWRRGAPRRPGLWACN